MRILNDEVVKNVLDIKSTVECVEKAYTLKAKQQARLFSMISEEIIEGKAEMDIKSGMLDGDNVFGLKLVSWFGDNVKQGLPAITGLTMIFDLVHGFPKGVLNASYMTGMRTGTAGALGIKYLARPDSSVLSVVGTVKWLSYFNFDVHNISGPGLDNTGQQRKFSQPKPYTIPYGCLVPKKIDNLLLAGRNISGTHIAHSNYRVMPICMAMGHASGVAAALCAKHRIVPRKIDVKELQSILSN